MADRFSDHRGRLAKKVGGATTTRSYRDDTFILETVHRTATGAVRVTDVMPLSDGRADLVRVVEGIEGEVEMHKNHALEDYEVRAGYVLSCQSFPMTDKVVVTYDE